MKRELISPPFPLSSTTPLSPCTLFSLSSYPPPPPPPATFPPLLPKTHPPQQQKLYNVALGVTRRDKKGRVVYGGG